MALTALLLLSVFSGVVVSIARGPGTVPISRWLALVVVGLLLALLVRGFFTHLSFDNS